MNEYDEMTAEEHANEVSEETDRIYDELKDEKTEKEFNEFFEIPDENKNDTQENFNKVTELIRELTDKKTDRNGKIVLFIAIREFLRTELNRLKEEK